MEASEMMKGGELRMEDERCKANYSFQRGSRLFQNSKIHSKTIYRNSDYKFETVAKPVNKGACSLAQNLFELGFPHVLWFLMTFETACSAWNGNS